MLTRSHPATGASLPDDDGQTAAAAHRVRVESRVYINKTMLTAKMFTTAAA